jgi:hypothetical protein
MPLLLRSSLLAAILCLLSASAALAAPVLSSYESPNSETFTIHGAGLNAAKQVTLLTGAGTLRIYQPSGSRGPSNPAGDSFVWSNDELTITGDPRLPGVLITSVNVDGVTLNQGDYYQPARITDVSAPSNSELMITGLHFTSIPDLHVRDENGNYHSYANPRQAHRGSPTGNIVSWTDTTVRVQDPQLTNHTVASFSFSSSPYPTDQGIGQPYTTPIDIGSPPITRFISASQTCSTPRGPSDISAAVKEVTPASYTGNELLRVNLATGATCILQAFPQGFEAVDAVSTGNGHLLMTADHQQIGLPLAYPSNTYNSMVELASISGAPSAFEAADARFLYGPVLPIGDGSVFFGGRYNYNDYAHDTTVRVYKRDVGQLAQMQMAGPNSLNGAIYAHGKIVTSKQTNAASDIHVVNLVRSPDDAYTMNETIYTLPTGDGHIVGFAEPADAASPLVYFATFGGFSFNGPGLPSSIYSFNVDTGAITLLGSAPTDSTVGGITRVGANLVVALQPRQTADTTVLATMPLTGGALTTHTDSVSTLYLYDTIAASDDGHVAVPCTNGNEAQLNTNEHRDLCFYDATQAGTWAQQRITIGVFGSTIHQLG